MSYFVTGATGFIGRFLVANLLKRKGTIHVLVRKDSQKKFDAIAKKMDWDMKRITVLHGDMAAARCGLTAAQVRALKGKVKHFFHLAAIYDLDAGAEAQRVANVDGRSEEHTSELQSLMRNSYAVFCLNKKTLHNLILVTKVTVLTNQH